VDCLFVSAGLVPAFAGNEAMPSKILTSREVIYLRTLADTGNADRHAVTLDVTLAALPFVTLAAAIPLTNPSRREARG
jgi:hypothetical protein